MADRRLEDIDMASLVIGKGQMRRRDVGDGIDELAANIRVNGLLEPITVCISRDVADHFEVLAGQRRFLACSQLGWPTIPAIVVDAPIDEDARLQISAAENAGQRAPVAADWVDVCTHFYHKYGDLKTVAKETGLPYRLVQQYVKFDRLRPEMQDLVRGGDVDLKVALRAQDAITFAGDYDPDKAAELAKSMTKMTNTQQEKAARVIEENPAAPVEKAEEIAKTAENEFSLTLRIQAKLKQSLGKYAKDEGTSENEAAALLVEGGLLDKGYLQTEE